MAESSRNRPPAPSPTEIRRIQDEEAYPYIITQEIGKGSFATVYKGYHNKSRKAVAIKTVSRSILTHKLLENLESEISILKALTHKHITELKDIVKARNNIYLIMEFCSGGDLSKYIRHRGRIECLEYAPYPGAALQYWPHPKTGGLDPIVVRSFLGQLASALKFLRDRNLIHRDIKPQNLLLEPSTPADAPVPTGVPLLKIADFGFARSLPNAAMAETLCGSPLYMAPEILRYEKYDAKADLWSVGAVLYEMSVGKPPFRAQNHMELLKKIEHARGRVNFPDEVAAKEALKQQGLPSSPRSMSLPKSEKEITVVPPDMKALIRMLLKRKPVERASFEEFFEAEAVRSQLELLNAARFSPPGRNVVIPPTSDLRRMSTDRVDADGTSSDPSARRREKTSRENIDKDALPLEGTPYDPKLYVPQTTLKFRRADENPAEDVPNAVAGPSITPQYRRASSSRLTPMMNGHMTRPEETKVRHPDIEERNGEGMSSSRPEREYVMVDAALTESAIDGQTAWKRPPSSRTTSTGARGAAAAAALTKQVGRLVIGATIGNGPSSGNQSPKPPSTPSTTRPIPIQGRRPPPSAIGTHGTPPFATSYRRTSDPVVPDSAIQEEDPSALNPVPMTFPPPPNPHVIPASPTISSSPYAYDGHGRSQPSALARAINLASKKLFGSPTNQVTSSPGSSNGAPGLNGSPRLVGGVIDDTASGETRTVASKEIEDKMLADVETIAQKAQVLKEFADTKYVKVPSKTNLDPSQFTRKKGEPTSNADSRRKTQMEAEQNAVTSIALYLATMGFCQKGINELNRYCEEHFDGPKEPEAAEASSGVDDAIVWFKDTFKSCFERSEDMKAWLPDGHKTAHTFIDRVIYDHALALMRHAASKELLEENFPLVQKEYEKALWMLYAIADDVIQEGNPFSDQDVKTIGGFIETTKTRLMRLKRRMETAGPPEPDTPSPRIDFMT